MTKIVQIVGREIMDSRGLPTVEAEVHVEGGFFGLASVPSGSSVGSREAIELRDNERSRFLGKGVMQSVERINKLIARSLKGRDVQDQQNIDQIMIDLDGKEDKSYLGANSILAVSLASAKAAAAAKGIPLYEHISILNNTHKKFSMPLPMINILNGGKHADNNIDIQEFMIQPIKAKTLKEAVQIGSEIFQNLAKVLKSKKKSTSVGDEGGYAPDLESNIVALEIIKEAVEISNYRFGEEITLAIDCAASTFFNSLSKRYFLSSENRCFTSKEFTHYLQELIQRYPILSIEDGLDESDWDGFIYQTKLIGRNVQLVGDDLFVTNTKFLKRGIQENVMNAILIKPNQIGSLTETLSTIKMAKEAGYSTIISHRSGETEDSTIADIAVGTSAGQIKTGSMSRSDRMSKYNQLIRIEETLGNLAPFNGEKELKKSMRD